MFVDGRNRPFVHITLWYTEVFVAREGVTHYAHRRFYESKQEAIERIKKKGFAKNEQTRSGRWETYPRKIGVYAPRKKWKENGPVDIESVDLFLSYQSWESRDRAARELLRRYNTDERFYDLWDLDI